MRPSLNEDLVQGLGFSQPKAVSILGGKFSVIDETGKSTQLPTHDPEIGVYMDVVIVDSNPIQSRIYYGAPYDSKNPAPPKCWSDNGMAPSINAIEPQALRCDHTCPQNARTEISKQSGALVTPCRPKKKLAVLISGQTGVWLFAVPAASLRHLRAYAEWVGKQQSPDAGRKCDVADLITRVYFLKKEPNILQFRAIGAVNEKIKEMQEKLWDENACESIVGRNDVPRTAALPAPQTTQQVQPPPPPQPAPMQSAGFQLTTAEPAQTQTVQPAQDASLSSSPRKRRTKAEMNAARQVFGNGPAGTGSLVPVSSDEDIPDFLKRQPAPPPPPQTQSTPQTQFGIGQGVTPDPNMLQSIADAFKLPT